LKKIKYIPFLKLKRGEFGALSNLKLEVKSQIIPFFDYPRLAKHITADMYLKDTKRINEAKAHLKDFDSFYLDSFDIDSNLKINGQNNYRYILETFSSSSVIPVIGIDRDDEHMAGVIELKRQGKIISHVVAIRIQIEDTASFSITDGEIEGRLSAAIAEFKELDLIIDLRVCNEKILIPSQTKEFIENFCSKYVTRAVVVSGSSIPKIIKKIARSNQQKSVNRTELSFLRALNSEFMNSSSKRSVILGDYTVVSPDYSDFEIDERLFRTITVAKVIYSYSANHYIAMGETLKIGGNGQYGYLCRSITLSPFYRGTGYSFGDGYLNNKSNGGSSAPGAILKPTINAHITYMVKDYV
jgi:hypothetical protein